jgi:PAS domain S-box-containing protein
MSSAEHAELELLRRQLAEAEDALSAIRTGEIDAIVVQGSTGPVVYTLKSADTPYRLLVEQMREGAFTVSADGIIIYANAAFARMVDLPVERLRGADLMEMTVDVTEHPSRLFVGPSNAGRDIRLRTSRGEVRNVYMSSAPLTIDEKQIHCVIAIDLTRQELRRRHEAIVNSSADAIYSLTSDGTITTWNQAAEGLYGYASNEVIGRKMDMLFPAEGMGSELSWASFLAARQSQREAVQVTKSGKQIDVAISIAKFDGADVPEGISVIARDISERNRAQEHIKFLLRESSHRSKNLLAVIQAIAFQTARAADTVDQFQSRFGERLRSMALSHDLLVSEDWKRANLGELVRLQLQPFAEPGARLRLDGSDAYVTPDAAQYIGLALHELATNAAKYGAWSVPAGQVVIKWEILPDAGLHLSWRERNGPSVRRPLHKGFGSTLTENVIVQALEAKVFADFAPEGRAWTIEVPPQYVGEVF